MDLDPLKLWSDAIKRGTEMPEAVSSRQKERRVATGRFEDHVGRRSHRPLCNERREFRRSEKRPSRFS
jgi:hypothetical protein